MNKKEQYEAPLVECYEIKLERRPLMASDPSKGGIKNIDNDNVVDNSTDWSVVS